QLFFSYHFIALILYQGRSPGNLVVYGLEELRIFLLFRKVPGCQVQGGFNTFLITGEKYNHDSNVALKYFH
ncbi:MAG: hypothetical protein QW326_00645, partial [Fervidicoccaceae archaeon]